MVTNNAAKLAVATRSSCASSRPILPSPNFAELLLDKIEEKKNGFIAAPPAEIEKICRQKRKHSRCAKAKCSRPSRVTPARRRDGVWSENENYPTGETAGWFTSFT